MIPKIIHYCWFGGNQLDALSKECIESWRKYCPDYKIIEWNENNFNIHSNRYVEEAYTAKKYAFVSDYVRLYALKEYGGIYMDTDVELIKGFDAFINNDGFLGFEDSKQFATAVIGAKKENQLIDCMLNYYNNRSFILPDGNWDLTTNVDVITRILKEKYNVALDNTYQKLENVITLYPKDYFSPKDYETNQINITGNTVSIHHFNASWYDDRENEFNKARIKCYQKYPDNYDKAMELYRKKRRLIKIKYILKDEKFFDSIVHLLKAVSAKLKSFLLTKISSIIVSRFNPKIIAFESLNGLDGNAGALYKYLLNDEKYNRYKFVWLIRDKQEYHQVNNRRTYVFDFKDASLKKTFLHSISKYLIYDNVSIVKINSSQISVYLTHGCPPLKNVKGIINTPDFVDYALCTSDNIADIFSNQISIDRNKLFISGLPRNDVLKNSSDAVHAISDKMYDKIIIWLPTFRRLKYDPERSDSKKDFPLGIPLIENMEQFMQLNSVLHDNNMLLILKMHPGQDESVFKVESNSNILILNDCFLRTKGVDLYSILNSTDALLTDYSSVAFDYMLLDKPIGYVIDDMNDYEIGFAFDDVYAMMPGEKIKTIDQFYAFIKSVKENRDDFQKERNRVLDYVSEYRDFNNCKRVADFLGL